jgi:hypothetical protein
VPLYERCLARDDDDDPNTGADASSPNLRWEAAHNLSSIFKASGAPELAREVLKKHATIVEDGVPTSITA